MRNLSDREYYEIDDALSMAPNVSSICDELAQGESEIAAAERGESFKAPDESADDFMDFLLEVHNKNWRLLAQEPSQSLHDLGLKINRLKILSDDAEDENGFMADGLVPLLVSSIAKDVTNLGLIPPPVDASREKCSRHERTPAPRRGTHFSHPAPL